MSLAALNDRLQGVRVLVTRPARQAEALCRLIEAAGGEAVRFPTLEIVPSRTSVEAREMLRHMSDCHWIFFLSANAVYFAQKAYNDHLPIAESTRVVAIGGATARVLELAGIKVDLAPKQQFNSETLLAMPELQAVSGQKCLIVRGEGGRELIAETLRSRGALVDYAELYRRRMPEAEGADLPERLVRKAIDAVVITSAQALENLLRMAGVKAAELLKRIPLVVVSDRIRREALDRGFARVIVADNPSDGDIVEAVKALNLRGKSVARAEHESTTGR